ncbi:MAG TPA: xanthine dehydrogenase family protein subunit M [bacterium]
MIPDFNFIRPENIEDALGFLAENNDRARIIAGGTDIIPGFQQGSARFQHIKKLIDVSQLEELKTIEKQDQNIIIGAGVTFSELMKSQLIREHFPILAKAASSVGSVQIRNRATIAGNFINNAPCADSVPPLLVYNAKIKALSSKSEREISLEHLLAKAYQTNLKPDELVTQIILPIPSREYRGDFYKLGRRRGVAISRITLALLLKIENAVIEDIRIASGAVTPIGTRFSELEQFCNGKPIKGDLFKILAQKLGERILEITGLRWSSAYKLPVVQQMFFQLISNISENFDDISD